MDSLHLGPRFVISYHFVPGLQFPITKEYFQVYFSKDGSLYENTIKSVFLLDVNEDGHNDIIVNGRNVGRGNKELLLFIYDAKSNTPEFFLEFRSCIPLPSAKFFALLSASLIGLVLTSVFSIRCLLENFSDHFFMQNRTYLRKLQYFATCNKTGPIYCWPLKLL